MKKLLLVCLPLSITACTLSPGIDIPWTGSGGSTGNTGGGSSGGRGPCMPQEIGCEPALEATPEEGGQGGQADGGARSAGGEGGAPGSGEGGSFDIDGGAP